MIIENARELLPEMRLKDSSAAEVAAAERAEEPSERRLAGAEERWGAGGGGNERRLGAPRPSLEEAPPNMLGLLRFCCFGLREDA